MSHRMSPAMPAKRKRSNDAAAVHSVALAFCADCDATFHRWRDLPQEYQCECYGLVKMVDANHPHNRPRHAG